MIKRFYPQNDKALNFNFVQNDEDFIGEYAGWEPRFCGKLFKHVDNSLEEVYFTEFVDDIVSNIDKYNED